MEVSGCESVRSVREFTRDRTVWTHTLQHTPTRRDETTIIYTTIMILGTSSKGMGMGLLEEDKQRDKENKWHKGERAVVCVVGSWRC